MVEECVAQMGRRRVRYLAAGAGWPLLLVHGFPLNAEMWRPQLERVPDNWRFIAPDLRGFGRSAAEMETEPGAMTMAEYADDLVELLDALEIDRAVVGGLSMGGYVTFALFRRAAERFSGLVLADTRPQPDAPEGRQARRAMSELVRRSGPAPIADQMMPKLLGPTTQQERPALADDVRRLITSNSIAGIDAAIHAMMSRPDSTPDLARVAAPTLVVVGEEDVVTPVADSRLLSRAIPRSRLVVLPQAGHLSNLEAPDEFSRAVEDFLTSNL
jgi:pimeloyl-ACP methyl ester carboxylesterase